MATFYFNGADDIANSVNPPLWSNLGNWWMNSGFTVPATALPTSSDSVVVLGSMNTDGPREVVNATVSGYNAQSSDDFNGELTVSGLFTLTGGNIYSIATITGNCSFTGVYNNSDANLGTIVGNCVFYGDARNHGTITGDCTFNDASRNSSSNGYPGVINGNCTFNDNSGNSGTVNGDCIFNDDAINQFIGTEAYPYQIDSPGIINGNATFTSSSFGYSTSYYSSYVSDPTGADSSNPARISGTITFTSLTPVSFLITGSREWYSNTTNWIFDTPGANWTFGRNDGQDYAFNSGTIVGDCVFNNSYNYGTITGNCIFNDSSRNDYGTITGNCTFNDYTYSSGTITGNCTFNDGTSNYAGAITGDCVFNDSAYNDGTITGTCIFNHSSYNNISGAVYGDCTFNHSSYNNIDGAVYGDCTFNHSSYNHILYDPNGSVYYGAIDGDCTFNDSSYNNGIVNYDATFNDSSYNNGTVSGTLTFTNRTPYPIPRGINGSSILGVI